MENPVTGARIVLLTLALVALVPLGEAFGYVRAVIGITVLVTLLVFGFKYWRDVGLIPPEPDTEDVSAADLRYVCSVCGLTLRVEIAARDKAPSHCGEPMELKEQSSNPVVR